MARDSHKRRTRGAARSGEFRHGAVVGIGASAGGLEAFSAVLESLPADTGMSFVFISHLDPKHESILTSLLARTTPMPVLEAKHGMAVEPDHVYVIPRNATMAIEKGVLSLSRRLQAPMEYLPIDHFMKSLAQDRRQGAIGVILSGTASDGTIGLTAIKRAGGITLAQDPGTAKYDGMPRSAIRAKVVDHVLSPQAIGDMLAQMARSPGRTIAAASPLRSPETAEAGLESVFALLRVRAGVDFSAYKEATVGRRIRRRMALRNIRNITDYARLLRREPAEVDSLYEDLLIKVTEFFRDSKTFEHLGTRLLPSMLKKRSPGEQFRVWVPGCSTGEEAYSIAILLFEVMARLRVQVPIQIFATDLSERAIAIARKGIYTGNIAGSISPARRKRFFVKTTQGHKIVQRIREVCVFARQDMTKDPPFSKVDLVSCRNVLIYMGKTLQDTILPVFHYALKPNGFLLLGKAEALESYGDLFVPVDRKHRIFRKRLAPAVPVNGRSARPGRQASGRSDRAAVAPQPQARSVVSLREEAQRLIMEKYAPAGVVINENMEILEILGDTHPYVRLTPGTANLSLLRLVRRDLVAQLSAAVDLARRTGAPVRREGRPVQRGHAAPGGPTLEIIPLKSGSDPNHRLLVLFEEDAAPSAEGGTIGRAAGTTARSGAKGKDRETVRLRNELADSQEHLRLLMDGRQTVEEELKSANEELMSSMEELQSANEELQTSHEELESTNEELTTVNDQLAIRNRDLTETSNDLTNLVSSVNVPIVILTGDLRLRRSTVAADKVMGLTPADVGRHVSELRHTLRLTSLEAEAAAVLKSLEVRELEVQDRLNIWYTIRLRPYRTEDDRIDGVVVVLSEIDRLKLAFQEAERARNFSRTIVEAVQEPLLVVSADRRVLVANNSFLKTFHLSRETIEHRLVHELEPKGFHSKALRRMLDDTAAGRAGTTDFEIEFDLGGSAPLVMAIDARQFDMHGNSGKIILLTMKDVTKFRRTERRLVASRDSMQKGRLAAESSLSESNEDLRASRAELRILAGRLIRGQEDERKRVARELHDDLSQRLSALQLGSAELARLAPATSPVRASYEAHQEHLAEIVEEVRRLSYDLHPSILTHLGLRAALQSFCVDFSAREGIDVEFSAHKEPAGLPEEIALCLYRVTQESLRNVARHADAKSVKVSCTVVGSVIRLTIQDRGKGFEIRPDGEGMGLGLLSMNERVRLVHGTIQVKSRVGHGTQIDVRVPFAVKHTR